MCVPRRPPRLQPASRQCCAHRCKPPTPVLSCPGRQPGMRILQCCPRLITLPDQAGNHTGGRILQEHASTTGGTYAAYNRLERLTCSSARVSTCRCAATGSCSPGCTVPGTAPPAPCAGALAACVSPASVHPWASEHYGCASAQCMRQGACTRSCPPFVMEGGKQARDAGGCRRAWPGLVDLQWQQVLGCQRLACNGACALLAKVLADEPRLKD